MPTFELNEQDTARPALDILQDRIPAASRAYLRNLLRRGKVLGDGRPLAEDSCLHGTERLQLPESGRLLALCATPLPQLTVLLETADCLAVFKPAGMAVHACEGHRTDNLTDHLRTLMRHRRQPYRVSPVHRLDIGTSGPVLFGKGRRATAELGRMLQAGGMRKTYLALVHGDPPAAGILTSEVEVQGRYKAAATRFRVCARHHDSALLELELLSGRKHQIRQQCAAAGWPLYGDRRYGGPCPPDLQRLFLHCSRLRWTNPTDSARQHTVASPLPADLLQRLQNAGIGLCRPAADPTAHPDPEHPPYA